MSAQDQAVTVGRPAAFALGLAVAKAHGCAEAPEAPVPGRTAKWLAVARRRGRYVKEVGRDAHDLKKKDAEEGSAMDPDTH